MGLNQRLARLERARQERLGTCPACCGRGPVHTFYVRPVGWEQSPDHARWEDRPGRRHLTGDEHPHEAPCPVCGRDATCIIVTFASDEIAAA